MRDNSTKGAYNALADWFEYLNDDCGYDEWSQYLIKRVKELSPSLKTCLDIGCGSGYFTRELKKAGFLVTGVDISPEMLNKAERLTREQNLKIPYILGDVTKLKVMERADLAVAVNDCFNYVQKDKLLTAFKKVYSSLKKGGYFFFDISSEYKLKNKVADKVSADDREDITYLSVNSREGDKVIMDVTLFVKCENGLFERFDERHLLYIYTVDEVKAALCEAGFEILDVRGHLDGDINNSDRINFACKRA